VTLYEFYNPKISANNQLTLVLDASAKKSSGFIVGNNHWLGSQFTCESVNSEILTSTTNQTKATNIADLLQTKAPINVAFKLVYAKHQSPFQINDNVFEEVRRTYFLSIFFFGNTCFDFLCCGLLKKHVSNITIQLYSQSIKFGKFALNFKLNWN
jgi:hypothetical protein